MAAIALALAIAGWFSCCIPLAPIGLWLAVKARREGAPPLATAALIAAIFGTMVWVAAAAVTG